MKKAISLIACSIICVVLAQYRLSNSDIVSGNSPLKITTWDAFGYYIYLPSICIYQDIKELKWLAEIDKKYAVTGGNGYQAIKLDNGKYTFKYLGGVAILELPFFLAGHFIAKCSGYAQDGFSPPYQYALGFGVLIYCLLAVFLLRKILLLYFSDLTTGITLLLVCLGTNFIQYAAVDNGQSHAYIFPLYVLVMYTTIQWHKKPRKLWAILTGYIIGIATICRPTEAIMLFIPLLWNTHTKEAARQKWVMVKQHKSHIIFAAIAGITGILPQLIYWKITTGSFLYDVGSKWEFLAPHFRVLFGWEKGWFIYTPVTIFFILGMFFMKEFPFKKSVAWFCFLNIYIIIAWHDWRYGGSYSTRALVQSYPVFALPLAALIEKVNATKWRWLFYTVSTYLLLVNLFQVNQYDRAILHYDEMNRKYYGRIYLNPHPSPVDMSMLDNDEIISDETKFTKKVIVNKDSTFPIHCPANSSVTLVEAKIDDDAVSEKKVWLKVDCEIFSKGFWPASLDAQLRIGDSVKHTRIRLSNVISPDGKANAYAFYMSVPKYFSRSNFRLYIVSPADFEGSVNKIKVTGFEK